MSKSFKTIKSSTEGIFKEKGSKFISYAFPISNVDDVKPLLEKLKTEHPTARHVCYAYQLGFDGNEYRANDDGEPNGSAGLPILNQIKSKDVTNVLVAVVRYFDGTKLGVSGLINAYKEAAIDALDKSKIVKREPTSFIQIQFPHSSTGDVERIIGQNKYTVSQQEFGIDCNWKIQVKDAELERAIELFSALPQLNLTS